MEDIGRLVAITIDKGYVTARAWHAFKVSEDEATAARGIAPAPLPPRAENVSTRKLLRLRKRLDEIGYPVESVPDRLLSSHDREVGAFAFRVHEEAKRCCRRTCANPVRPATTVYFRQDGTRLDGLTKWCKGCRETLERRPRRVTVFRYMGDGVPLHGAGLATTPEERYRKSAKGMVKRKRLRERDRVAARIRIAIRRGEIVRPETCPQGCEPGRPVVARLPAGATVTGEWRSLVTFSCRGCKA